MAMRRRLDLQAKISLVLVAVILPTFLIVTVAENKFTQPILEEEMRQVGITSGKTLAAEIVSARLLSLPNPTPAVESSLQEFLYSQPNITRIDVFSRDPAVPGRLRVVASNVEEDPLVMAQPPIAVEAVTSEFRTDEGGAGFWDIYVPIEQRGREPRSQRKLLGAVHVEVSLKVVDRILGTLWKTTATAAALSVVALIFVLSYFLRKTILNDRKLRQAESQNLQLTEQLHEAERQLMNTEKLAVMGQLTASFAHEIGTPLNAIGGHLQLLHDEISAPPMPVPPASFKERFGIIDGQLSKIEQIVKGFLQTTAKPQSQKQLVDLNQVAEKTLGIVRPRLESLGVEVRRDLDRGLGPLRLVPLDVEQILLNLLNNSLDSMQSKDKGPRILEISTGIGHAKSLGIERAEISVYDTGSGISKADLPKVLKPFFTTKPHGKGTGLGLTICQELAQKYGGSLDVNSKEGEWTRVSVRIPYRANT